jgi:hypothetical protein
VKRNIEFTISWGKTYDSVCALFASLSGSWQNVGDLTQKREKCARFFQIQCSGCNRTFSFSQLMDIGALTVFRDVVGFSAGSVDNSMANLSRQNPGNWLCPCCGSEHIVFRLLVQAIEPAQLSRFKKVLAKYVKNH